MAFKQVTGTNGSKAISITKGVVVTGYLIGCKSFKKKFGKEERENFIYQLKQTDGTTQDVWGNGAINQALRDGKGINPLYKNFLVRLTGGKKVKIKNRPMPMQEVLIEVDDTKKLK